MLIGQTLRERDPTEISLLLRTSCDDPPPTSTDCSIHDRAATLAAVDTLLLQA